MKYGSVCSGIEAATVAWHPLGWRPSFFSEIEKFPRAVLAHHFPEVSCHGDFTSIQQEDYAAIDLLVGGTPCQDFSVAGLRAGMAGERGRLTVEFCELARRLRPKWLVWENVPGVLSADDGKAFGIFLGLLGQLGYGFAYRVLDAQHFGVPQRRRRVFVVGHLGDWRRAAAVLFERDCLSGNPPPRREPGERPAPTISARTEGDGGLGTDFDLDGGVIQWPAQIAGTIDAHYGDKMGLEDQHLYSQQASRFVESPAAFALRGREGGAMPEMSGDVVSTIRAGDGGSSRDMVAGAAVRRLTPRECERLQGFPDDFTLIPVGKRLSPDGSRYKALGNSMAVPVMRWIGERIAAVEAMS